MPRLVRTLEMDALAFVAWQSSNTKFIPDPPAPTYAPTATSSATNHRFLASSDTITQLNGSIDWAADGFTASLWFRSFNCETAANNFDKGFISSVSGGILTTGEAITNDTSDTSAEVEGWTNIAEHGGTLSFDAINKSITTDGLNWSDQGFAVNDFIMIRNAGQAGNNTQPQDDGYYVKAIGSKLMILGDNASLVDDASDATAVLFGYRP